MKIIQISGKQISQILIMVTQFYVGNKNKGEKYETK